MVRWLSDIAGFLVHNLWVDKASLRTSANLVEPSEADLEDIYTAAHFSNVLAESLPIDATVASLERKIDEKLDAAVPLDTGLSVRRKGVLFRFDRTIVLAFEATKSDELRMNAGSYTKDKKWSLPYPRLDEGPRVHSFHLDTWLGMRQAAIAAITDSVLEMEREGHAPLRLLITGYSMGGGVSTLAIVDVVQYVRVTFGSDSTNRRPWALDSQLGNLVRHVTFAELGASGTCYNANLYRFCERYRIPAWDIVHPKDLSTRLHLPSLRAAPGHRIRLPDPAVRPFEEEYQAGRHAMLGYKKSVEWLRDNPRKLESINQWEDCANVYP